MGRFKGKITVVTGGAHGIGKALADGFRGEGDVVHTHAMAISLSGKVRVNSISPGWIDTTDADIGGAAALQQPVGRVGKPEDIAEMALSLCSDKAGFINGENVCVDGGMTKLMIYHREHGWEYRV